MHEQRMTGGTQQMDAADAMDRRVAYALERLPAVDIPAGFAARVAARIPAQRAAATTASRYGLMAARICTAALLIAIMALSMRASGHTAFGITLEWILCGELVGLCVWMSGVWRLSAAEG